MYSSHNIKVPCHWEGQSVVESVTLLWSPWILVSFNAIHSTSRVWSMMSTAFHWNITLPVWKTWRSSPTKAWSNVFRRPSLRRSLCHWIIVRSLHLSDQKWATISTVIFSSVVPEKRSTSTCSLQTFAREVIDLLKQQTTHCRLPLSKFVTNYHMKYSRHCRAADYGFEKILDLLLAIPNAVQVGTFTLRFSRSWQEALLRYWVMGINVYWPWLIAVKSNASSTIWSEFWRTNHNDPWR